MADSADTDIVMLFILNGQPVYGESMLSVDPNDQLMQEFQPGGDANTYSNFFELKNFALGLQLSPSDNKSGPKLPPGAQAALATGSSFGRWYTAAVNPYEGNTSLTKFNTGSFDRLIDAASPIFFQACCNKVRFDKAIIIKRASQDGDRQPFANVRIEMTNVLLTNIDWDDGDVVTEKCSFTCDSIIITYVPQNDDGTVDASGSLSATWQNPTPGQTT